MSEIKNMFQKMRDYGNSGMRSVSKLLLNSFWGKFGQIENKYQNKIIPDTIEWFKMISNDAFIIQQLLF